MGEERGGRRTKERKKKEGRWDKMANNLIQLTISGADDDDDDVFIKLFGLPGS